MKSSKNASTRIIALILVIALAAGVLAAGLAFLLQ